ncbi:FAD/NAD(P)-binding domain-containing protein [Corynespora cassiicola Philippines]|uniref:FAD/NAD(P)-binding domain-containing protein n=1 Tax=Corynespora cassiicola Philippines TaxID=1448308 RepID=A0A2T2NYC4_CORCC|nr:FAD/NAD(P)-binding domain-containing protein [Corynespora cassiicola Philippines]
MTLESKPQLQVAICGGGIAGLTFAAFTAERPDIEVHVFESKPEIRAIGSGIAIWKRFWDIIENYVDFEQHCTLRGLRVRSWSEALIKVSAIPVNGPVLRKADDIEGGNDFSKIPHGPRLIPRDDLLDILRIHAEAKRCHIKTNKKMTSYAQDNSGRMILSFEDNTNFTADLLIGADGVHSRVRHQMFSGNSLLSLPKFSGQFAYRMSCPRAEIEKRYPDNVALHGFKIWCGKGRHITSNTVRDEIQMTAYDNVFDADGVAPSFNGPWVAEVPAAQIAERYADWEEDLVNLLRVPKTASRWAIHVVTPLPTFVADRVCLIGDAAHAMTPHQGLGGGQGIEDAYILARLLQNPLTTASVLPQVLKIYDSIRRPASQTVANQSFTNGLTYGFLNTRFCGAKLTEIGEEVIKSCFWLLEDEGAEKEWLKANSQFNALLEKPNFVSLSQTL